jgi:hypothetical protein
MGAEKEATAALPSRPDLPVGQTAGKAAHVCANCGEPLPRIRRWMGKDLCERCEDARRQHDREAAQAERVSHDQARERYRQLLEQVAQGAPAAPLVDQLRQTAPRTGLDEKDLERMNADAAQRRLQAAVADDRLTPDEEQGFDGVLQGLGLSWGEVTEHHPELSSRYLVAMANDGRLPMVADSRLMSKRGEVVHLEQPASLMKEVSVRQYVGGYSGWSFPIGKTGIRYRVGGVRGHSEVVGTQLQVADAGTLVISSVRAVFIGGKSTIEMPYAKLVGVQVFTDGIRFNLSNRQKAPLFKLPSGDVVAAFIHIAMQGE